MKHFAIAWALFKLYVRITPQDWYRRAPFLPVPPREYLQWRLRTAYGEHRPSLRTVLNDLWRLGDWLREFPSP